MINSNELRLGNIVKSTDPEWLGVTTGLSSKSITLRREHSTTKRVTNKGLKGLDVEGVHLTRTWLLKYGFQCDIRGSMQFCLFSCQDGPRFFFSNARGAVVLLDKNGDEIGEAILYVHELQNLYFALTRQELKLQS